MLIFSQLIYVDFAFTERTSFVDYNMDKPIKLCKRTSPNSGSIYLLQSNRLVPGICVHMLLGPCMACMLIFLIILKAGSYFCGMRNSAFHSAF